MVFLVRRIFLIVLCTAFGGVAVGQRPEPTVPKPADRGAYGGYEKGTLQPPGPMHIPVLKASGTIVNFNELSFTVEDKHGKHSTFLCCEKQTTFEARHRTPLGNRHDLKITDFAIGDVVELHYEALHNSVRNLKLLSRPKHRN
jgi:hypothetical protein